LWLSDFSLVVCPDFLFCFWFFSLVILLCGDHEDYKNLSIVTNYFLKCKAGGFIEIEKSKVGE
jgi:hypothetical protein